MMDYPDSHTSKPVVIVCNCPLYPGRLAWAAARNLAETGRAIVADFSIPAGIALVRESIAQKIPTISIDGCRQDCCRQQLDDHHCPAEFSLNLADLGIEGGGDAVPDPDELLLVQDAILAGATRTGDRHPRILGGCGCR